MPPHAAPPKDASQSAFQICHAAFGVVQLVQAEGAIAEDLEVGRLVALQGQGVTSVRELARRVARDDRRVHDDVEMLAVLGLVERADSGGAVCPFQAAHVDMRLMAPNPLAA